MTIKLNQPIKPNLEVLTKYLSQVNDSGWYTNFGPLHQLLTKRLEEYLGVENLLLVSNGTLALQVAYKTLNVQHALTTPFSFVATTSSLLWQNIQVSYSDIERSSYNLSAVEASNALKADSSIDTIVATHVYGNPCDVNAFYQLSQKNDVKVIYDAAHAFGVRVKDKSVLNYGDASTLSFHATKVFHTIEGGAVIFKKKSDYERAKRLINFGIDHNGEICEAGINAKLNEYQCAVGLTILDQIEEIINHRANLFSEYRLGLADVIETPEWHENTNFNGAYMPINLGSERLASEIELLLSESGVQCRRYFKPSLDTVFKNIKNYNVKNSNLIANGILCLPLHYYMTQKDVGFIINSIKDASFN
jgi:dTDP-4-amino-4,6-dideoxygalactose transaminase